MAAILEVERDTFLESPLLAGIDESSRRAILRHLTPGRIPVGSPLLSQGQANDRLWFVVGGSVAVEHRRPDGRAEVVAAMNGPGIYGTTTFFRSTLPTASIRATSELSVWTLDRPSHDLLRRENPTAAEALAMAIVRVLSERFDLLDLRIAELMAEHGDDHPRVTELATFRTRLFEEPVL